MQHILAVFLAVGRRKDRVVGWNDLLLRCMSGKCQSSQHHMLMIEEAWERQDEDIGTDGTAHMVLPSMWQGMAAICLSWKRSSICSSQVPGMRRPAPPVRRYDSGSGLGRPFLPGQLPCGCYADTCRDPDRARNVETRKAVENTKAHEEQESSNHSLIRSVAPQRVVAWTG